MPTENPFCVYFVKGECRNRHDCKWRSKQEPKVCKVDGIVGLDRPLRPADRINPMLMIDTRPEGF